jgi:hypothetical protein
MGRTDKSKITVLDGSVESYRGACVLGKEEFKKEEERKMTEPGRVHTADNEGATWLDVLMAVESMEEDSRNWQKVVLKRYEGGEHEGEEGEARWPPKTAGGHTLSVCIQRKKKSWEYVTSPPKNPPLGHPSPPRVSRKEAITPQTFRCLLS